ncbi:selenocysteine-specific translation elongation factor [Verrucomicrobiales bacterium BCK34]|nr:selenocysteine-specific translation elongation factor [Verrucomicrobiales bacterium BCK34]
MDQSQRHFILGTAGHIDHGKSSLIEKLTGTDPDRLPEEKARGMTIELGFAQLSIPAADDSGDDLALGVVDVPGHADFVKNMVAGVGAIDLALFIVAADDGWMPQTEEHYQILTYLGVKNAVVALTKVDLAEDLELVLDDLKENLEGGIWENAPIVPVSSHTGEGIDELRETISKILTEVPVVHNSGKPRLPVDRAFTIKGVGTVVTGTLTEGAITTGSDLVVHPGGESAHVRSAQSHNQSVESVPPGTRTALNLTGISLREDRRGARSGIGRGDVLTLPNFGEAVTTIDVLISKSDRGIRGIKQSTKAIRTGRQVMFHHGSSGVAGRVHFLGQRTLKPGESALAEIRFKKPVFVFAGDRFVIRNASLGVTLAGGIVLDEDANRRAFRKPFQEEFLKLRAGAPHDLETLIRSQLKRDMVAQVPELLLKSHFSSEAIAGVVGKLVAEGALQQSGDWVFEAVWWKRITGLAEEKIMAVHRDHPDQLGFPLRELRTVMEWELPAPKFFDNVLEGLLSGEFAKAGPNIRHRDHIPQLPPELVKAGQLVRKRLASDLKSPPNKGETATNPAEEKALRFLVHTGEVIELDPKTVISNAGYDLIQSEIVAYLGVNAKATASELRQHTGTVRRILMPLLERLDDCKVTVREGDERRLR